MNSSAHCVARTPHAASPAVGKARALVSEPLADGPSPAWKLRNKGRAAAAAARAIGRAPAGLYMRSPFFVAWNHKHSHEVLAARLTESILRHENDFMQEGRPRAKIESIEGLVTLHIKEMEAALSKRMGAIAAEHTEQIAEVQQTQSLLNARMEALLEALGYELSPYPSPMRRVDPGLDASGRAGEGTCAASKQRSSGALASRARAARMRLRNRAKDDDEHALDA